LNANIVSKPNHSEDIITGLEAGIRGINMDIGKCIKDGERQLSLVRSNCALGYSDPLEVLTDIHQFLTENPNEVIIMPTRIDDNTGGAVGLEEIHSVMKAVVDDEGRSMADRLYAHPPGVTTTWPTLGKLIDGDQRIIFFHFNGAETCQGLGEECPVGFHDWFAYAAETAFSFANTDEIKDDPEGACTITRGGDGTRDFFGINVFVEVPSSDSSAELNDASFLQQHIEACSDQNGLDPSLILVDFWSEGDVLQVVEAYNKAHSRTALPTPGPTPRNTILAPATSQPTFSLPSPPTVSPSTLPSTVSPTVSFKPASVSPRSCNGLGNLCYMPANEVLFATMHNANSYRAVAPFAPVSCCCGTLISAILFRLLT
jgi:hypothetical protein